MVLTSADQLPNQLPSTLELPYSDDQPVDNEDQNLLPNLLLILLTHLWSGRTDWYFGVDMGVYHTAGDNPRVPVVPDAFLSIGVNRKKNGKSRLSYATWEEGGVVPTLALEMVSHKYGKEYEKKVELYASLGVLYYIIYNPEFWQRDRHQPFEVYRLENGVYQLQSGEPYWMPEVGLGIGRYQTEIGGYPQEILTWYDEHGNRHLSAAEQASQENERLAQEKERLAAFLRSQGFDPDNLPQG